MEFLLLCKPIVVKNLIKPDVHKCDVIVKQCDSKKCSLRPMRAPPVTVRFEQSSKQGRQLEMAKTIENQPDKINQFQNTLRL